MQALLTTGVAMKRMPGFRVAYVEHRGPFDEIGFAFQKLLRFLRDRRIHVFGPMIAMYPPGPAGEGDERGVAEAAVPVPADFREDSELRTRQVPPGEVASLIYEGPPSKYPDAISAVGRWVDDNDFVPAGPMREIYARDLSELPPRILYVEIQQPVKRKRRS